MIPERALSEKSVDNRILTRKILPEMVISERFDSEPRYLASPQNLTYLALRPANKLIKAADGFGGFLQFSTTFAKSRGRTKRTLGCAPSSLTCAAISHSLFTAHSCRSSI
jgi:hypothetical protein